MLTLKEIEKVQFCASFIQLFKPNYTELEAFRQYFSGDYFKAQIVYALFLETS